MQLDFSQDEQWQWWAQAGFNKLLARNGNAIIQSSQVSAIVPSVTEANPYAALPRAIAPPTALVLEMLPPVTPAMPFQLPIRERMLELALARPNVQKPIMCW